VSTLNPRPGPPHPTHLYLAARFTLLNCLTAAVPARERVITCEEVFELDLPSPDVRGVEPDCRSVPRSTQAVRWSKLLLAACLRLVTDRVDAEQRL
jgi:Flp pilus assembly CpaF family ATPase